MLKILQILQMFADANDNGSETDKGSETKTENFDVSKYTSAELTKVKEDLAAHGYDILINNKSKSDYVPHARLQEVIVQRDAFKSSADTLQTQLQALKTNKSPEVQKEIDELIKTNQDLLLSLEKEKINLSITNEAYAAGAINATDLNAFINKDNLKVLKSGEILGIKEEIARLQKEKSYLFNTQSKKAGGDLSGQNKQGQKLDMNAVLRAAFY